MMIEGNLRKGSYGSRFGIIIFESPNTFFPDCNHSLHHFAEFGTVLAIFRNQFWRFYNGIGNPLDNIVDCSNGKEQIRHREMKVSKSNGFRVIHLIFTTQPPSASHKWLPPCRFLLSPFTSAIGLMLSDAKPPNT